MVEITLSYVLTTFNKISYIKVVLPELIRNKKIDEEIIVIDGGSTDGTCEFISELKRSNEIDYFISERDTGEAHGFNKGVLLAKGDLIKVVTDDDAYNYMVIKRCKDFMIQHPEIDVLGGNTGNVSLWNKNSINWDEDFYLDFLKWQVGKLNRFFFNGTCLMIRRSSLPLIGLFDSSILLTDMEYTLRMTGVVNLAWCTSFISVRILNPLSNNLVFKQRAIEESERLCLNYSYKYPWERKNDEQKKRSFYMKARSIASKIKKSLRKSEGKRTSPIENFSSFEEVYKFSFQWMQEQSKIDAIQFLKKIPKTLL